MIKTQVKLVAFGLILFELRGLQSKVGPLQS